MRLLRILLPSFLLFALSGCTPALEGDHPDASGDHSFHDADADIDADDGDSDESGDGDGSPGDGESDVLLHFLSPDDGAVVSNPVTFEFQAEGIAAVQIEADEWPLSPEPWNPVDSASLTYHFSGTGFARDIRLFGFNDDGQQIAEDRITITIEAEAEPPGPGIALGTFKNTYYYLAEETAHSGPAVDTLYDMDCSPLATVSESFANAACIEGTALLADGRVINYFLPCSCGGPCSFCWSVMDPDLFPWGKGSQNNPLEPLRSWAVDTNLISPGTILYVEEWDGLEIPSVDGLGGEPHDGCFRADDVGGAIIGNHVDIFAGSRSMWLALEAIFPTRSEFIVYGDSPRCSHL